MNTAQLFFNLVILVLIIGSIPLLNNYLKNKFNNKKERFSQTILYFANPVISFFTTSVLVKIAKSIAKSKNNSNNNGTIYDTVSFAIVFLFLLYAIALLYFIFQYFVKDPSVKSNTCIFSVGLIISLYTFAYYPTIGLIFLYICSLFFNYLLLKVCIKNGPSLFSWASSGSTNIALLTFLWTIITFILGMLFNIKP